MKFLLKQPCIKDCPNRSADCHAKCEKYLEYAEKKEQYRLELYKEKQGKYHVSDYVARHINKVSKIQNKNTRIGQV